MEQDQLDSSRAHSNNSASERYQSALKSVKSPRGTTPSKKSAKKKEFKTESEEFGKLVWILKDKNKESDDKRIQE